MLNTKCSALTPRSIRSRAACFEPTAGSDAFRRPIRARSGVHACTYTTERGERGSAGARSAATEIKSAPRKSLEIKERARFFVGACALYSAQSWRAEQGCFPRERRPVQAELARHTMRRRWRSAPERVLAAAVSQKRRLPPRAFCLRAARGPTQLRTMWPGFSTTTQIG